MLLAFGLFYFCYSIHSLVPSPAQNVMMTSNGTLIIVRWSAPATLNGNVSYSLEMGETDLLKSQTTKEFEAVVVTELSYVLEYSVRPYSGYSVNVTSQTVAGMGESEMASFNTPEEGN